MAGVVGARKPKVILHDAADQAEHLQEMQRLERRFGVGTEGSQGSEDESAARRGHAGRAGQSWPDAVYSGDVAGQCNQHGANHGANVPWLLLQAEQAGYAIPLRGRCRKRLTERSYRVRDIAWNKKQNVGNWWQDGRRRVR